MLDQATKSFVAQRAGNRCEYCKLPQSGYDAVFHVDHILALQHSILIGLTPVGRATVATLDINDDDRVRLRIALVAEGRFF